MSRGQAGRQTDSCICLPLFCWLVASVCLGHLTGCSCCALGEREAECLFFWRLTHAAHATATESDSESESESESGVALVVFIAYPLS